ncbi:MAG: hypothetical protein ACPGWM_09700, partial [Flavobacteriales bacterium]
KLIDHPLSGVVLDSLLIDVSCMQAYNNGFLAGTWNNGLKYIELHDQSLTIYDTDVAINGAVNDIKSQGHQFWLATDEGCVIIEPHDFISLVQIESEKGIVELGKGKVLTVASNQVLEFDPKLNELLPWKQFNDDVDLISSSPSGIPIVLVNGKNFIHLDQNGNVQKVLSLNEPKSITMFLADEMGTLWWAEDGVKGVFSISSNGDVRHFGKSKGIAEEPTVLQINESTGELWIGAEGNASFLFHYNQEQQNFRNHSLRLPIDHHIDVKVNDLDFVQDQVCVATQFGLFNYTNNVLTQVDLGEFTDFDIHGLKKYKDRLWFGTSKGLICKMGDDYLVFNRTNGLPARQISYGGIELFNSSDLWVSSSKGIGCINASILPEKSPACSIRSIICNNRSLDLSGVSVSTDEALMIDFANTLPGARRAQYQYRVSPGDTTWQACSKTKGIMVSNLR